MGKGSGKNKLTRSQKYHAKKRNDPFYIEDKRRRAAEQRKNPEWQKFFDEYLKEWRKTEAGKKYNKEQYQKRKDKDTTVRERIKKSLAWQKEAITDSYVKRISRKKNMTPEEIEIKRNEILIYRINKQIKLQQNGEQ